MPRVRKREEASRGIREGKGEQHLVGSLCGRRRKAKGAVIGAFSDAVNFYRAEKVKVRKRIIAPSRPTVAFVQTTC